MKTYMVIDVQCEHETSFTTYLFDNVSETIEAFKKCCQEYYIEFTRFDEFLASMSEENIDPAKLTYFHYTWQKKGHYHYVFVVEESPTGCFPFKLNPDKEKDGFYYGGEFVCYDLTRERDEGFSEFTK